MTPHDTTHEDNMDQNELTNFLATGSKDQRPPEQIWTGYCDDREMCRSIRRQGVLEAIVSAACQKAGDFVITSRPADPDNHRPWGAGRHPHEANSYVELCEFFGVIEAMHSDSPPFGSMRTVDGVVPKELHIDLDQIEVEVLNEAGENADHEAGITFRVAQTLWTPEQIDIHMGKLPSTPKHEATIKHFFMDLFDKSVEGYCTGQTWNGWRVPYFTKAQMEAVMTQCNKNYDNEMDWHEGNVLVPFVNGDASQEPEVWYPETIEGIDEPVWSVGGMSWCWESEDTPHEETDSGEWLEVTS
jgi:hypothetical protein